MGKILGYFEEYTPVGGVDEARLSREQTGELQGDAASGQLHKWSVHLEL